MCAGCYVLTQHHYSKFKTKKVFSSWERGHSLSVHDFNWPLQSGKPVLQVNLSTPNRVVIYWKSYNIRFVEPYMYFTQVPQIAVKIVRLWQHVSFTIVNLFQLSSLTL
jgi:hypothetical protein